MKNIGFCIFIFLILFMLGCSKQKMIQYEKVDDFLLLLDHAILDEENPAFVTPSDTIIPGRPKTDESHWGIFQHAPSAILYKNIYVGKNGRLDFSIAIKPNEDDPTQKSDGVRFVVEAIMPDGMVNKCFDRFLNPLEIEEEQNWESHHIALQNIEDVTVDFRFKTLPERKGGKGNNLCDWAVWGNPSLVSTVQKTITRDRKSPNVLLITIDTCRADYLGCYGNSWIQTPALDQIAKEGILFENAFAASSTTSTSHTSILTSLRPYQHGVLSNEYKLAGATPQLTQIFHEANYQTGAAVSVFHLRNDISGLGKNFDTYLHISPRWENDLNSSLELVTRGARTTTNAAINWLGKSDRQPFFLWVHYYDPHAPYHAEGSYHKMYYSGDPRDPSHHSMEKVLFQNQKAENFYGWTSGITDLDYFKKEYGAEISYVDSEIARLMNALKILELRDNTLIVVTGDHGENFGDHQIYFDHWALFNSDIHVPLILSFPKKLPHGLRLAQDATHIDIAPTILDLVGMKDNFLAKNMFDGRSLRTFWENPKQNSNEIITAEGLLYTEIAAWDNQYKLIWELRDVVYHDRFGLKMDRVRIYDRKNDPHEENPIGEFDWGTPAGRAEFAKLMVESVAAVQSATGDELGDLMWKKKLNLYREYAGNKEVPTEKMLRELLTSKDSGSFVQENYLNNEEFLPRCVAILKVLKERVSPVSLPERLKSVVDVSVMTEEQSNSIYLNDRKVRENLRSLGYSGDKN